MRRRTRLRGQEDGLINIGKVYRSRNSMVRVRVGDGGQR